MGSLHAHCFVRLRIHVLRQFGCFGTYFLRVGGTRILKSILSCFPEEVAALVVDNGSGVCFAGLLVTLHPVLCFLRLSAGLGYGEVCTVDASVEVFALSPV